MSLSVGDAFSHPKYGRGEVMLVKDTVIGIRFIDGGQVNFRPEQIDSSKTPVSKYLRSEDGKKFIELLRKFEHTMYVKVRNPDKFFSRYETVTGYRLSRDTAGVLISEQEDKWGDELSIRFDLGGFEPNFPVNAEPRVFDDGKGILNDNEYIWALIEQHGFRLGRVSA